MTQRGDPDDDSDEPEPAPRRAPGPRRPSYAGGGSGQGPAECPAGRGPTGGRSGPPEELGPCSATQLEGPCLISAVPRAQAWGGADGLGSKCAAVSTDADNPHTFNPPFSPTRSLPAQPALGEMRPAPSRRARRRLARRALRRRAGRVAMLRLCMPGCAPPPALALSPSGAAMSRSASRAPACPCAPRLCVGAESRLTVLCRMRNRIRLPVVATQYVPGRCWCIKLLTGCRLPDRCASYQRLRTESPGRIRNRSQWFIYDVIPYSITHSHA